jgi:leucyl/phenylalanyl-tRNA---protein transferase
MFFLTEKLSFPPVGYASEEGIVAFGGDLSSARLLVAYKNGIFPWFEENSIIIWWSPDPRMVLFPHQLKISKSVNALWRKNSFQVTYNKAFEQVIHHCAHTKRKGQTETWITQEMKLAYIELHQLGYAISVEVWQENQLVGGLYGVDLGHVFCGESMFSKVSNASKIGFISLVKKLQEKHYKLIDCQVYTPHLASLGAVEIPRKEFLTLIKS